MKNTSNYLMGKRLFDLLFSAFILIASSPLFLAIALTIKLTSPGPIIYSSQRVKRGRKTFECFKFRTMHLHADEKLAEMLATNPELRREWIIHRKLKNDPRITPFGKFLRKSSLDELPQFFNVLLGDMSVVGPRPLVPSGEAMSVADMGESAKEILSVKPGITGLWQISGRSHLTIEERIALDLEYLQKRSFWLDLRLIAKTIPHILIAKGAY